MLHRLLRTSKYHHLKIVHQYPNGINNRYKDNADKWVQGLGHPHIKTYYDFYYNMESHEHTVNLKVTQKQQNYISKIKHSYKPGVAMLTQMHILDKPQRPDDYQMDRDISDLTFKKFIQEGKENFTPVHSLAAHSIGLVVLVTILYFTFIYDKELPKNDRVKMLNAEFTESYHFDDEQSQIQRIIERISIVNDEYLKRLQQSKGK